MDKIGVKFFEVLEYDFFEPLQYWLEYNLEYEDFIEHIKSNEVIELVLEDDEDRSEDIAMLEVFLAKLSKAGISYELFVMNKSWEKKEINDIR
ncbi:MAG: Unknown protein [uncultured Sulfurovum sp.]|uniref:Uncharacterized protein n=1 Tax=uncultured Sulfurovum sp. TaxID=269237 RepID=A0A6S6STP8_9BACT|nr:MAG: Unknown protein [uncultured Sulfurovum sp.]